MVSIVTVDVEGHRGKDPIKSFIWGLTKEGNEYGLKRICDIFTQYGYEAILFLDFAEAYDYGEEKIKAVVDYIKTTNHHIGVHIHPDHMADRNRLFLYQYSYDEQFEIIKKCTDLYVKLVGENPIAFRAGKYSADRNTLEILSVLGYKYDFSEFYGNKWCGINPPICYQYPTELESGLIEIPVSVFQSLNIGHHTRIDKIDMTMDSNELITVVNRMSMMKNSDDFVLSLFFHSFSLLKNRKDPENLKWDKKAEQKLIKALKFCNENRYTAARISDFASLKFYKPNNTIDVPKGICKNGSMINQVFFNAKRFLYIIPTNKKARHVAIAFIGLLLLVVILLIVLLG